jgi:hypothetical protein
MGLIHFQQSKESDPCGHYHTNRAPDSRSGSHQSLPDHFGEYFFMELTFDIPMLVQAL